MRRSLEAVTLAGALTVWLSFSARGVAIAQSTGGDPAPPKEFFACYVSGTTRVTGSGTVYRIKEPNILQQCLRGHVEFSWVDGAGAVRTGDAAGGDLFGTYPNPTVARLQSVAVSSIAPTDGQVLGFDAGSNAWKPVALLDGTIADHGQLSGLLDDDHPQYLLTNGVRASTDGFAVTGTLGTGVIPASGAGVRLMWYAGKAALRAGEVSTEWDDAQVGTRSVAMGQQTTASGQASTAFGQGTTASAPAATALGASTIASGSAATAMGVRTTASGTYSTAMGELTAASGDRSTAMGTNTVASGLASTAMGSGAAALGNVALAVGAHTQAIGNYSTAFGINTIASGASSIAVGSEATAGSSYSMAVGGTATASGFASRALGNSVTASGDYSTAIGPNATASGNASTAVGFSTVASGASAMALGVSATASGDYSTAMGFNASTNGFEGSFVFADHTFVGTAQASAANQFLVRASGGFRFRTSSDLSTGCDLPAGSGVFSCTSSRALKTGFESLDGDVILNRVRDLPLQTWRYKTEPGVRHLGPFAEDFYAAFHLGPTQTSIGLLDIAGVSLAAAQALERRTRELAGQLAERDVEIAGLRTQLTELKERLERLEAAER